MINIKLKMQKIQQNIPSEKWKVKILPIYQRERISLQLVFSDNFPTAENLSWAIAPPLTHRCRGVPLLTPLQRQHQ